MARSGAAPGPWGLRLRGIAAAIVCATLLALAGRGDAAHARPLVTGITNTYETSPLANQRVRATGATFVRIPLDWNSTAPQTQPSNWQPENPADPRYNWGQIDEQVINAVQAGLEPVVGIGGPPKWAQRCTSPNFLQWAICDPDPAAYHAYAVAAARHFSGQMPGIPRVRFWQGFNEPNLSLFFFPQLSTDGRALSPDLYRALINAFYAGIKSVDQSNLVLTGGLGPIAVPPWTLGPMRFARELLCMTGHRRPHPKPGNCGGGVNFDILSMQPYTTGAPTHEGKINDVQLGDLDKLRTLIKAADRAGRINGQFRRTPIWITEFSWDTNPPDPGGLAMKIATRWTAEALYRAWHAGVTHFFWYSLHDTARDPSRPFSETWESGLYFNGGTLEGDQPKETLFAYRFPFVAFPEKKGLVFWGRTPTSSSGKVVIQILKGKRWRKLQVARADRSGIFKGVVRTGYGRNKRGATRALYGSESAVPFSMRPVKDFYQEPFG